MHDSRQKFLFCKVGWMPKYQGESPDAEELCYPFGTGSFGDCYRYNFLPYNGYCYGNFYILGEVFGRGGASHPQFVCSDKGWTDMSAWGVDNGWDGREVRDMQMDGVTVIWVAAHRPSNGKFEHCVVGFYKNATVHNYAQKLKKHNRADGYDSYNIKAKAADCVCFSESARPALPAALIHKTIDGMKLTACSPTYSILRNLGCQGYYDGYDPSDNSDFYRKILRWLNSETVQDSQKDLPLRQKYGKGGESQEHKNLKEYACGNPALFGMPEDSEASVEVALPSGDFLDVLLRHGNRWTAVEVKSRRSDYDDITRGIYQCIKYQAVLDAMSKRDKIPEESAVFLFLENKNIPAELMELSRKLRVQIKVK